MEIKAQLNKPYTEDEKITFIIEQNHNNGYEIRETEKVIQAWGLTEEEIAEKERERISMLSLTRGDVFRGLLKAKGVTKAQIRAIIENLPETNEEETVVKELALIDFDDSLNFYRGVQLIDVVGLRLGITPHQLDRFFETNDYRELMDPEPVEEQEEIVDSEE